MKKTIINITPFILTIPLLCGWTHLGTTTTKSAPATNIVKITDLKNAITQEAYRILQAHGLDIKNLPHHLAKNIARKISDVTTQLSNNLTMQHKTEISLAIVQKDTGVAINPLINDAIAVVSRKILTQTVDNFITNLIEEKSITIAKLPTNMATELGQRREAILTKLTQTMANDGRDYVYVSELERECHTKLDLFLERAKYVLISIQSQNVIAALDSLRLVTGTQPFPVGKS